MVTKYVEVKSSVVEVARESYKHVGNMITAYNEQKWWRLFALVILTMVMAAAVLYVKPLLVMSLSKWFVGTWGLPLFGSKVTASCVAKGFITQLGNVLKYWILKIDK